MTFVIGSVSYYIAGEDLSTSLYAAFTLYFVSPTSSAYNAGIEIARWMAAIVMTAAILHIIAGMWQSLRDYLSCVKSNIFKKGSIMSIRISSCWTPTPKILNFMKNISSFMKNISSR